MPTTLRWQGNSGRETIKKIVKKVIPHWTAGLRPAQEDLCSAILDGDDFLCCLATGDGKSSAFSFPILVLNEYNRNRALYPAGLPTRSKPVGMVVTPTRGLAANIVLELRRLGLSAFSYCRESLADARRRGVLLVEEIKCCDKWQVICVDPEHLRTTEWREISDGVVFRSNIVYGITDETHLINEWGGAFRTDFQLIGIWLRGRLPVRASIGGLTATLAPGVDTTSVCDSLGLFEGRYHLIRRTNERPNIQLIMRTLSHGLNGYEFPDLLPFLNSGRKTVVHFSSLDILFRCYVFIWRSSPRSANKMRRTRMYTSLCAPDYNEDTIRRIEEDPQCQIILATIAFSNGINAKSILDSISVGFSSTVDIMWQEKGRAGRESGSQARGVILVQKSSIALAQKQLLAGSSQSKKTKRGARKTPSEAMNLLKARFLTETHCYIAFLNRHYGNPPLETSTLDCIAAKRPLPCSLCQDRSNITLDFPAPASTPVFPTLTSLPLSPSTTPNRRKKTLLLTRNERKTVEPYLKKYRHELRLSEHKQGNFLNHPQTMFLPSSIQSVILDNLMFIASLDDLNVLVRNWRHRPNHSATLYEVIQCMQIDIQEERNLAQDPNDGAGEATKARNRKGVRPAAKRKAAALEEDSLDSGEEDYESDSSLPAAVLPSTKSTASSKRRALDNVSNVHQPRRPRAPQKSAADEANAKELSADLYPEAEDGAAVDFPYM